MKRILLSLLFIISWIGHSQVYNHNTRVKIQTVNELSAPVQTTEVLVRDTANGNEIKHVSIQDLVGVVGTNSFIGLSDTPSSYSLNQYLRANISGTALEFVPQDDIHNFYTESGETTDNNWTSTMGLSTGIPFIKLDKNTENQIQINLGPNTIGQVLTATGINGEANWATPSNTINNIYNNNGSITANTDRHVDLSTGASLAFRSPDLLTYMFIDDNEIDIRNGQGTIRMRTGNNGSYESNSVGDFWTATDAFGNGKWQTFDTSGFASLSGNNVFTGTQTFQGTNNFSSDLNVIGSANINMGASTGRIVGLNNPINPQEAATKAYVDANSGSNIYTTNGTITEDRTVSVNASGSLRFNVGASTIHDMTSTANEIRGIDINLINTSGSRIDVGTDIEITQGNVSNSIKIQPTSSNISTVGQVLTATDTDGSVAWQDRLPYKIYTALIIQDGTNTPTAIELENTTGATMSFTRISQGNYMMTSSSSVFTTVNQTSLSLQSNLNGVDSTPSVANISYVSSTQIEFYTAKIDNTGGTYSDSCLNRALLEIKIYP